MLSGSQPRTLDVAVAHPERVTAIASQNGNAYEDGLGEAWESKTSPARHLGEA